jgi:putative heme-binding domain-containing protein
VQGDSGRGKRLFDDTARTKCGACHAIGGHGATLGPNLSALGGGRATLAEILDAILEPSAKIHADYPSTVVALIQAESSRGYCGLSATARSMS